MIQRVTYWDLEDLEKREVESTFMCLGKSWDRSVQVGSLSMRATGGCYQLHTVLPGQFHSHFQITNLSSLGGNLA